MTEQELVEIEKDMNSNNGSWVANEKVIQLIKEVRKLKLTIEEMKSCRSSCQKKNLDK